jgi:membrane-associated protease RseP (regulator of RpoE activity)
LSAGISLSLAFMNLLPFIFILDGGQAFLLIIEWIIGRPFGQSVRTWLMWASFVVIIALSLFVLQQDIFRLIGK